jgi:hypothetical protein
MARRREQSNLITRLKKLLAPYLSRYPRDERVAAVRAAAGIAPPSTRSEVAIECVEDLFYLVLFTAVCRGNAGSGTAGFDLVVPRSAISGLVDRGWGYRVAHAFTLGNILGRKWRRAYDVIGKRIAYRGFSLRDLLAGIPDWFRCRHLWRSLAGSTDISSLRVLGVHVGDLVIDSYLRFRPAPCFDVGDPFVLALLWQAHRDVRRARRYFRHAKPRLYLTSFSTYIEHGVPVRVALQEGVEVRSFGNFTQFGKRLTAADTFHTANTAEYRKGFAMLDRREERLAAAEQQLQGRLAGKIDDATNYMKVSAYQNVGTAIPDVHGAVIVFLHDFYDSPHIYDDLVFPDFWTWVTCTIETLTGAGVPFFLKPHPNQVAASGEVIDVLCAKFPAVRLLPVSATNVQLATAGMICGVTVYGTVAHELAFLGIPSITCARHPHHVFDFCRTARSAPEYIEMLRTPAHRMLDAREMREQALTFYYMHNLHGSEDDLAMRSNISRLWRASHGGDASPADLVRLYETLRDSPRLAAMIQAGGDAPFSPRTWSESTT